MARKPRVQFPDAIYHVVTRGDGRRKLFHDHRHYQRFTEGLEAEVLRSQWQIISYCWMPNHIHLLVKTPQPNLSNGMQHWLSGYANWYARRNQRSGHLYQGRFKAFQVEDMSYFWPLSRYIHLNPCVGKKPLAQRPQDWQYSSYRSYIYKRDACGWLANDLLKSSWRSEFGGKSTAGYRQYVERELGVFQDKPLEAALEGWALGSEKFLKRLITDAKITDRRQPMRKRTGMLTPEGIIAFVAKQHHCTVDDYKTFRSQARGRAIAALLCRELTNVSLADLSLLLGMSHPDSSAGLARKAKISIKEDKLENKRYYNIMRKLLKNEKQG
jgi:REP element-mobilizing transposase RayT